MKKLYILKRQVYGKDTIYPACDDSKVFAELLNRKTFTERDIRHIKTLGYEFEILPQTL